MAKSFSTCINSFVLKHPSLSAALLIERMKVNSLFGHEKRLDDGVAVAGVAEVDESDHPRFRPVLDDRLGRVRPNLQRRNFLQMGKPALGFQL